MEAKISEGRLLVNPVKSGNQSLNLWISDGEGVLEYSYHITVTPLWKVYWWIILLFGMIAAGILWKVFHKPKPVLDQITGCLLYQAARYDGRNSTVIFSNA